MVITSLYSSQMSYTTCFQVQYLLRHEVYLEMWEVERIKLPPFMGCQNYAHTNKYFKINIWNENGRTTLAKAHIYEQFVTAVVI